MSASMRRSIVIAGAGAVAIAAALGAGACGRREAATGAGASGASGASGAGGPSGAATASGSDARAAEVAGWREDLALVARELPARDPGAFAHLAEADWRRAVAELDARLPALDGNHARVALARLIARLGDSHTLFLWNLSGQQPFPLQLLWFDDGVFVGGAAKDQAWAIGRKVVALDGKPIDDVIAALTPLVGHENDAHVKAVMPGLLTVPPLLAGADLAAADQATYTLAAADGTTRDLVVHPGPGVALAPPAVEPLHRQGPYQLGYWNTYVAEQKLLYLQYNQCADDPRAGPFAKLAAGTLAFIDQHPVERVVIDLRSNGGGDSRVIAPLIDGLAARPALRGRVFVLIGRVTFSSAVLNAIELKQRLGATLVGTPTGGDPNGWGEVKRFDLPHLGDQVQHSTKLFAVDGYGDTVTPDLAVHVTSGDWFSGRDPAMDAVLAAPLPAP